MEYNVTHNSEKSRFELVIDGLLCEISYIQVAENVLTITHTEVPPTLEGRGIAAAMTNYMLEYARENSLKIIPVCSYTRAYMLRQAPPTSPQGRLN
ncbi:GNAT family N-acetyltransferase [Viscerimonas tarda]